MLQNALAPSLSQAEAIFVFLYKAVIDSKKEKNGFFPWHTVPFFTYATCSFHCHPCN